MDRFVPSVGFVVAGLGIAASFLEWTGASGSGAVGNVPGLAMALLATVAFAARRYDLADRRLAILAGLASGGLALAASVALLAPAEAGEAVSLGPGMPLAFVLGVVGVGVAYADYLEVPPRAFLRKATGSMVALGIGFLGLLLGSLVASIGVSILRPENLVVRQGMKTVLFSVALAFVAIGYLLTRGLGIEYIDVRWPTRRGWLYAVGGVVGMFVVLLVVGLFASWLGVPQAKHGLVEAARGSPSLLLWFVPLSWLAIGPGEELLMRNVVQKYLYESFSRRSAVLVATIVFASMHLLAYWTAGPAAVFATLVRLFAVSLVLGIVYERTDNVVVAALVHGTFNAVQFGLAYVALTSGMM
ncbi:MAG: lysostaphin resistance A-like protein [Halanaeroarchaeum sp.]